MNLPTIKKYFFLFVFASLPAMVLCAPTKNSNPIFDWMYHNIFLVMGIIVIGIIAYHLMVYLQEMTDYHQNRYLEEQGIISDKNQNGNKPSWLSKLYERSWNLIPIEKEVDIQLDHNYDGIQELDNSLPPWWLYLFYFTIAVSVVYIYVYELSDIGMTQEQEYLAQMEEGRVQRLYAISKIKDSVNENNVTITIDEEDLATGQELFLNYCAACHGQLGEGTIGPNFTDEYWIHGGGIKDLYRTIYNGVPEKGMISWKSQMQPSTIRNVASYILTLQGTDPPNQKKPQGIKYNPSKSSEDAE